MLQSIAVNVSKMQCSQEINSGGRTSVASFLWQRMIENMEASIAQREGGVTFQEFPSALQGAVNVVIRNQMQALLLFRALDIDGDGIISKMDCEALQAGNNTSSDGQRHLDRPQDRLCGSTRDRQVIKIWS